jgi:tRNA A-37 threonylcarbamoyl transferase component Bud32
VTPQRWQRINDIFHAALDLDPAQGEAYTRAQAGDDTEIVREVGSLLDSHRRSNGVLDLPAWAVGADLLLDDEPALAGKIVGKYRIVREIARGGMGVVYLARDQVLDRAVALKSLPMEYLEDPARRERLAREARMAAQLEHRAIATVYELQEFEGQVFIASEYVNGVTLRRELEDGPLPPGHLLGTLIEIAAALAAAHTRNIVHRDLKPENIIRREDGQIKVLDFGLAKRGTGSNLTSTRLTQPGIIAGTPGYMAPEVLGNKEADARSDIFVFGVIAWELATGKHPFGNHPNSQMARLHDLTVGNEVKLPGPLTTPGLDTVVRRCLRRLQKDRYDTADALLHDLRKLQTHDGVVHVVALPAPQDLWWWQFHQCAMAVLVSATPVLSWLVREWVGRPAGTWAFLLVLAMATASVTLRLNLSLTLRIHPSTLAPHRQRLFPWIAIAEALIAVTIVGSATVIAGQHEATAALLISLAIVIAASLAVIEPATTRNAGLTGTA